MKFSKLTSHALSWLRLIKMAPNPDSEFQSFNTFSANEEFQNNEIFSLDTKYYVPGEVKDQLKSLQLN